MSNLQAKINKLMIQQRKSAVDIAKETGVHKNTIYSIVQGDTTNPTAQTLRLIAKSLGVNLESLLIDEREIKSEHPLSQKQIKAFSDATKATADIVLKKKLNYTMDQLKSIINEVYKFAIKRDPPNIDPTFIEWLIEDKYKI